MFKGSHWSLARYRGQEHSCPTSYRTVLPHSQACDASGVSRVEGHALVLLFRGMHIVPGLWRGEQSLRWVGRLEHRYSRMRRPAEVGLMLVLED